MADPLLNNVFVAISATVASLTMASITAFVFARFRFPGREVLSLPFSCCFSFPTLCCWCATYQMIIGFGLLNTLWALIFPRTAPRRPGHRRLAHLL